MHPRCSLQKVFKSTHQVRVPFKMEFNLLNGYHAILVEMTGYAVKYLVDKLENRILTFVLATWNASGSENCWRRNSCNDYSVVCKDLLVFHISPSEHVFPVHLWPFHEARPWHLQHHVARKSEQMQTLEIPVCSDREECTHPRVHRISKRHALSLQWLYDRWDYQLSNLSCPQSQEVHVCCRRNSFFQMASYFPQHFKMASYQMHVLRGMGVHNCLVPLQDLGTSSQRSQMKRWKLEI